MPQISLAEYEQVLNRVFPPPTEIRRGIIFTLILRTIPAFGPESQVSIIARRGSPSTVQFAYVDRNVFAACNEIIRAQGTQEPDALASKIHLNQREVELAPSQLFAWQQGLFKTLVDALPELPRLAKELYDRGTSTVVLDADSFELWYAQGMTEFKLRFSDLGQHRAPSSGAITLVTWAHDLHDAVAIAAARQR